MNARSALMTRIGFPAVFGAVLALALALISGLGVTGGTSNLGGGFDERYPDGKEIGVGGVALSLATRPLQFVAMAQATSSDTATSR
jgi:hypothetical protein